MIQQLASALGGRGIMKKKNAPSLEYIEMPAGYWLWLSVERDGKRFISLERTHNPALRDISRHWYDPENLDTRIGFSSSKSIEQIARDIQRRLLPNCESIWQRVKVARSEQDDADSKAASMLAQLNQVCPAFCKPKSDSPAERHFVGIIRWVSDGYFRVDDNEVSMSLNYIPFSAALEIAAIIDRVRNQP